LLISDSSHARDEESDRFDQYVDALQNFVCSEEFGTAQDEFLSAHCDIFEDGEENKLSYMPVFQQWTALIERLLEAALSTVPDASVAEFTSLASSRAAAEVDEQILELLTSLGDFVTFKELILAHKYGQMVSDGLAGVVQARPLELAVSTAPATAALASATDVDVDKKDSSNGQKKKEDDDDDEVYD